MTVSQHLEDASSDLDTALSILRRIEARVARPPEGWRVDPQSSHDGRVRWVHETDRGDKGCQSCRRIRDHRGLPYFSETEERDSGSVRGLCIWCRRWADAYRSEWAAERPDQPLPSDPRRFWPPLVAIEWRRDNEGKHATPRLWIEWRAAKRAEKKGRKRAS